MAMSFLSAFRDSPPYRWYFVQSLIGTLNPFGTFIFYWCALIYLDWGILLASDCFRCFGSSPSVSDLAIASSHERC